MARQMKTATVSTPKEKGFSFIVQIAPIRMPYVGRGRKNTMDDKKHPNRAAQKRAALKD